MSVMMNRMPNPEATTKEIRAPVRVPIVSVYIQGSETQYDMRVRCV